MKKEKLLLAIVTIIMIANLLQEDFREKLINGSLFAWFIVAAAIGSWIAFFVKKK